MALLPAVQRFAVRKVRTGSAGPWGAVAAAAVGLRVIQRVGARRDDVVYREVIRPGHEVRITHLTDSRVQVAKADKRAERSAKAARRAARRHRPDG